MKTTIDMAREAGFNKNELAYLGDNFQRLVDLARAEAIANEREACAKVCERMAGRPFWEAHQHYIDAAAAIRARGNA